MKLDVNCKNISLFSKPVFNTVPTEKVSLVDIYQLITSDSYKNQTEELRRLTNNESSKRYKERQFDNVTFSGIFYQRTDDALKYHSEVICIDLDHLSNLEEVKKLLIKDTQFHTLMLFRSPSGDGLKWIVPISLSRCGHRKWFHSIRNYLWQTYQLEVDEKCVNPSRACFLPYDPECYASQEIIESLNLNQ